MNNTQFVNGDNTTATQNNYESENNKKVTLSISWSTFGLSVLASIVADLILRYFLG